ncbi:MAG: hypothetical protein EZS28_043909 [Streblomastix strix]|uniref:Uncharacterized protein n=1 Tax=Streblomastix strix TaxID=222440 RepID=A0A5J4TQ43_9EUKA|nr:MAG: hypothetical protein EZS28_043909 [Streblomastix strix]
MIQLQKVVSVEDPSVEQQVDYGVNGDEIVVNQGEISISEINDLGSLSAHLFLSCLHSQNYGLIDINLDSIVGYVANCCCCFLSSPDTDQGGDVG